MVRLIRMGNNYWTVLNNLPGYQSQDFSRRPDYSRSSLKSSSSSANSSSSLEGTSSATTSSYDLEQWPKRRAMFHAKEWFEWLGCESGKAPAHQEFTFR